MTARYSSEAQRLLDLINNPATPPAERAEAGDRLADLGDPRPGVGLRRDGRPDLDWVEIPAGKFIMGGDPQEPLAYDDEIPPRTIELPTFYIARYPITFSQFQAFMDDPEGYTSERWWPTVGKRQPEPYAAWPLANRPRETVSWFQAMAFCRWLSDRLGVDITLPTEKQWEKAARGPDLRRRPLWVSRGVCLPLNVASRNAMAGVVLKFLRIINV